jgi:cytosine/adenosine deaminase-related metal-dependent hydrolase
MVNGRKLLKGGFVITMDRRRRLLPGADVLVEDDRIAAIGHDLPDGDAEVLDCRGSVVMPGLVDTHRHMWQTNLRAMLADWTLHEYMRGMRFSISPVLRPEDIGAGNHVGALEALNAGVTTVFDYSHSNNTPDHASAGVEALLASGIRAVYGYGFVPAPLEEPVFRTVEDRVADAKRIKSEYLSSDDALVVMGTALTETGLIPFSETVREIQATREMACISHSIHDGMYWGSSIGHGIKQLADHGLLGGPQVFVHCNSITPEDFKLLADNGCSIAHTPDTEMQMGMGRPVFGEARQHGVTSTVGCDIITLNGGDIVGQLRLGLQEARARVNDGYNQRGVMPLKLETSCLDALAWGTINGAEALGLGSRTGSLEVGKQADVLVISSREPNLWPLNQEPGSVIFHSHPADIETVLVAGKAVKRDGRLVGVDYNAARRRAEASRDWILQTVRETRGELLPPEDSLSLITLEETGRRNLRS